MKRFFFTFLLLLFSSALSASEVATAPQSFDLVIDGYFKTIADYAEAIVFWKDPYTKTPLVLILLASAAIITTFIFGFVNITGLKTAVNTIRGKYGSKDDPGEINHFQALTAALSATVGLGNIAGVAVAISIGGAGATFWMILCGLFGMTTKFCECTLGVRYREIDENGRVKGGGMYYLSKGLAEMGLAPLGKVLAVMFALACVGGAIGAGNMFQGSQAYTQMVIISGGEGSFFDENGWVFGLIMAIAVGVIIIGGIKSIAKATAAIVPFMCAIYLLAACYIILIHIGEVPGVIQRIITEAFNPTAVGGGLLGAIIQGVKRAAFSNEAGLGSAPIAHSAVKTKRPASEGYVALLEPFIDTVVVCTITALVIILTGQYTESSDWTEAIAVTSRAFESVIPWFPYVLFVAVLLFAFSTMISWSYYGEQGWVYILGNSKASIMAYRIMFCVFVVMGCTLSFGNILRLTDALIFSMVFPNLIGLFILIPKIKEEVRNYKAHVKAVDLEKS